MRRMMILLGLSALLGACSTDKVAEILRVKETEVQHPNTILPLTALVLSTPPVNTILFGPCREEFMMPEGRAAQCELYHKIRSETSAAERNKAIGQAMAYQPGELVCQRTLGFKTECVVISGAPRPIYLNAPPSMGTN